MSSARGLAVFARTPHVGQVKTRLIPMLGETGAYQAYLKLAQGTLNRVRGCDAAKYLWVTPSVEHHDDGNAIVSQWISGDAWHLRAQSDGDLGQKMGGAFAHMFADGCTTACLIGVDCPPIDQVYLEQAFSYLDQCDVVLGPAEDGGYGLIGMHRLQDGLFESIDWGTSRVLEQTLSQAVKLNLEVILLEEIWDVDEPEDWLRFVAD